LLRLFGFSIPLNPAEQQSLALSESAADAFDGQIPRRADQTRFFGFSEIQWAIARFNRATFPERPDPEVLDPAGWHRLHGTRAFLKRALVELDHFRDDLSSRKALVDGVEFVQLMHRLPKDGVCDARTLRFVWDQALTSDCDLRAVCRLAELPIAFPTPPIMAKPLGRLDIPELGEAAPVQAVVNGILGRVPGIAGAGEWLVSELQKGVRGQLAALQGVSADARAMRERLASVQQSLEASNDQNDQSAQKFNDVSGRLEASLAGHAAMEKELDMAWKRIDEERRGNDILFIVFVGLLLVLFLGIA
jgi:hypothetical protein